MIYTGYAGSQAVLFYYKAIGLQPVIVSGGRIEGYPHCKDSKYIKDLAPRLKWWWPWHYMMNDNNKKAAKQWYTKYYTTQILNRLDPQMVYEEIIKLGNSNQVIICCTGEEQEFLFCHRHLIKQWLEYNIPGLKVKEYPHPSQYLALPYRCK